MGVTKVKQQAKGVFFFLTRVKALKDMESLMEVSKAGGHNYGVEGPGEPTLLKGIPQKRDTMSSNALYLLCNAQIKCLGAAPLLICCDCKPCNKHELRKGLCIMVMVLIQNLRPRLAKIFIKKKRKQENTLDNQKIENILQGQKIS